MHSTKHAVRAGSLVAALALAAPFLPALAGASGHHSGHGKSGTAPHGRAIRGIVVADSATLGTVTLNTPRGAVAVHVNAAALSKVYLGGQVVAVAAKLADGTYSATSMREHGRAHHTEVRGTVVSATAKELVVSSGGSQFALSLGARQSHASHASFTPGQVVRAGITFTPTGLDATNVQVVGQSAFIELNGTLTTVNATSLVISVENGALTTVAIPGSLALPSNFTAGTAVEMLVSYDATSSTFTLVTITSEVPQGGAVVSTSDSNTIEAEGLVSAVTDSSASASGSLTIQPGEGSAVTFVVPAGMDVSSLSVGMRVDAEGTVAISGTSSTNTLTSFEVQHGEGSMTTEAEGIVTLLPAGSTAANATSISIQRNDGEGSNSSITFTINPAIYPLPASITSGLRVHARGTLASGQLTLTQIWAQGSGDQGSQGNQGNVPGLFTVDGTIVSYASGELVLQHGESGATVNLTVPAALAASLFGTGTVYTTGVQIKAVVQWVGGVETLISLSVDN